MSGTIHLAKAWPLCCLGSVGTTGHRVITIVHAFVAQCRSMIDSIEVLLLLYGRALCDVTSKSLGMRQYLSACVVAEACDDWRNAVRSWYTSKLISGLRPELAAFLTHIADAFPILLKPLDQGVLFLLAPLPKLEAVEVLELRLLL